MCLKSQETVFAAFRIFSCFVQVAAAPPNISSLGPRYAAVVRLQPLIPLSPEAKPLTVQPSGTQVHN